MRRQSLFATVLFFALAACSSGGLGGGSSIDLEPVENPQPSGRVVSPTSGLKIDAAIASATLGDEGCSAESKMSAGTCVGSPPAMLDAGGTSGTSSDYAGCGPSACRSSSVQLQLTTAAGQGLAHVDVTDVELIDAASGAVVATLTTSNPQKWDTKTSTYVTFDQTVAPSSEIKVSYKMSSPPWSTLGSNNYGKSYRIRLTLRADGASLVLESAPLNREPVVST